MSTTVPTLDGPSDAELITAVRAGDVGAYGELFSRHVEAARRLGRQLVSAADVDDLVSEAFTKVLGVLQRGGGPDLAFRAYLLTAVRRLHVDRIRATSRLHSTDDLTPFDPGVPFRDTALEGFENATAARAFASLPERWQVVLWHTEVEEQKPADIAPLLGMTPNAVSALAYRAREGLRQAYLSMHGTWVIDDECTRTRADLGAYVRGGLSRRDAARVERHLENCRPCTGLYLELTEVNSNLRAVLAPLLLGAAATAYLASGGTAAGTGVGGVGVLLGRARDAVLTHASTAAVAGVAASAVVAGAALTLHHQGDRAIDAEEAPAAIGTASPTTDRALPGAPGRSALPVTPLGTSAIPSSSAPVDSAQQPTGPEATPGHGLPTEPTEPGRPSGSVTPSPATPGPTQPGLVQLTASASAGLEGVRVGLGLGVGGMVLVPETTLGVPLPPAG